MIEKHGRSVCGRRCVRKVSHQHGVAAEGSEQPEKDMCPDEAPRLVICAVQRLLLAFACQKLSELSGKHGQVRGRNGGRRVPAIERKIFLLRQAGEGGNLPGIQDGQKGTVFDLIDHDAARNAPDQCFKLTECVFQDPPLLPEPVCGSPPGPAAAESCRFFSVRKLFSLL